MVQYITKQTFLKFIILLCLAMFLLLINFILLLPFVLAENETIINHENVSLYPPTYYSINWSENNFTHIWPVNCLFNSSGIPKCSVQRTMNNGETYVRDDEYCDLHITSPQCATCPEQVNITNYVHWRVYKKDNNIYIDNLDENISYPYPISENFDFEFETKMNCPECDEDCEDESIIDLNITEKEWDYICGRSLRDTMLSFKDVAGSLTDYQNKLVTDYGVCMASNTALSRENGELRERAKDYDNIKTEREELKKSLDSCNSELLEYKKESGNRLIGTIIKWSSLLINFIIILGILFFKIANPKGEEY